MLYDSFKSNKNINDILNSEQPRYRVDLNLTDEEFINLLKKYISDVGIKKMFENANLEKDKDSLIVETEGEQPMIKFIKLTGAEDGTDVYVNVNKINAISSQNKRVRVVCISDKWLLVLETVEEILAKIEEVIK